MSERLPLIQPTAVELPQLNGLTALVIGGASGIGEATSMVLARNGVNVALTARDELVAAEAASKLSTANLTAIGLCADIASREDLDRVIERTAQEFGGIDIVVNSAAIVKPAPIESCSRDVWQSVLDVNLTGAMQLAQAVFPHLQSSPHASLINIASLGGVFGRANGGAYGPSKAGLIALGSQLGLEWAQHSIRVNTVNPGTIETPMARASLSSATRSKRASEVPMGRLGLPVEVANMVAFLASPAASYITSQNFNVDGGHSQSLLFAPMQ